MQVFEIINHHENTINKGKTSLIRFLIVFPFSNLVVYYNIYFCLMRQQIFKDKMKITRVQKNAGSKHHTSTPFFTKIRNGSFFSQLQEQENPFFSPQSIQTNLTIGKSDSKYEKEADHLSELALQRMSMLHTNTTLQRKSLMEEEEGNIQRKCEQEESIQPKKLTPLSIEESIQTKATGGSIASTDLSNRIQSSKGKGVALPQATRASYEAAFGTDFSGVKIHTDSAAIQMNKELEARAFTTGKDIYFNQGEYQPNSTAGKKLLGHELVHVVQQKALSPNSGRVQRSPPATPTKLLDPRFYGTGKRVEELTKSAEKKGVKASSDYGGTKKAPGITWKQFSTICSELVKENAGKAKKYWKYLDQAFKIMRLDTAETQAMFLAQSLVETGNYSLMAEGQLKRDSYVDDPTKVRLDINGIRESYTSTKKVDGKEERVVHQFFKDFQKKNFAFIGRGPLQVTFQEGFAKTLGVLMVRAKQLREEIAAINDPYDDDSLEKSEQLAFLEETIQQVGKDPRQASNPKYAFLFSAAYAKNPMENERKALGVLMVRANHLREEIAAINDPYDDDSLEKSKQLAFVEKTIQQVGKGNQYQSGKALGVLMARAKQLREEIAAINDPYDDDSLEKSEQLASIEKTIQQVKTGNQYKGGIDRANVMLKSKRTGETGLSEFVNFGSTFMTGGQITTGTDNWKNNVNNWRTKLTLKHKIYNKALKVLSQEP